MSKKFLSPIKLAQGATNPSTGSAGELFYNTDDLKVYVHNGTSWLPSGGGVTVGASKPTTAAAGDAWFDSNDGTLYVYYTDTNTSQWVQVQANSALEGSILSRLGGVEARATTLEASPAGTTNYFINGAMDYWQRATTGTVAANGNSFPSADRIRVISAGGSSPTVTLARSTDVPAGIGAQYSGALSWSSNSSSGDIILHHGIENGKYLFAGKTVTFSFYAKAATSIQSKLSFDQDYGETFFNLSTSWARYSYTITLPSTYATSRPSGSALNDNVELRFIRFSNVNSASNTIYFTGVQLEEGSVATSFRRSAPSLQAELAACQRYYYRIIPDQAYSNAYTAFGAGFNVSATQKKVNIPLPVQMRVPPTVLDWTGTYTNYTTYGTTDINGSLSFDALSTNRNSVTLNIPTSGATVGLGTMLLSNASSSVYLGFGAEI